MSFYVYMARIALNRFQKKKKSLKNINELDTSF